jgi:hypothetical protein
VTVWSSGPCPAPSPGAASIARWTKSSASATAVSSGRPSASPAVTAAERVQPVPWVEVVSSRACEKCRIPSGVTSTSVRVPPSSGEVPAFHQRGRGAEAEQGLAGALHRGHVVDHAAGEHGGLVEVGRHQRRQRQQAVADDVLRLGAEQAVARGRDHDRIEHQRLPAVFADRLGHEPDDARLGEHAGLERRGRQVFGQRGELLADHRLAHRLHCPTPRVFWAVSATMTEVPNTPNCWNVLRSA